MYAQLLSLLEPSSLMYSGKSWEAPGGHVGTMVLAHHFYGCILAAGTLSTTGVIFSEVGPYPAHLWVLF